MAASGELSGAPVKRPLLDHLEVVEALLDNAGPNRALLATAIMAGGLRVSEVTGSAGAT